MRHTSPETEEFRLPPHFTTHRCSRARARACLHTITTTRLNSFVLICKLMTATSVLILFGLDSSLNYIGFKSDSIFYLEQACRQ